MLFKILSLLMNIVGTVKGEDKVLW